MVNKIVPSPTIIPVSGSKKVTACKLAVVVLIWGFQIDPPSVVLRITQLLPTTVPISGEDKKAPLREVVTPLD